MLKKFNNFLIETTNEIRFVIDKNKFLLFVDNFLVSKSGFNIEPPDKWFRQEYLSLFNIETIEKFQGKGFAKKLLEEIFNYVKTTLDINIITLIVYKNNVNAINLYLKSGFEIFIEYDDSYSLKKLI